MREYGHSYYDVLALPLKTFWMLNRYVDRLRAEADLRALAIQNASQSGEAAQKISEHLRMEVGTPVIIEKKFDEEKFKQLQMKFSQGG